MPCSANYPQAVDSAGSHTILLVQVGAHKTWATYDTIKLAMEGVCCYTRSDLPVPRGRKGSLSFPAPIAVPQATLACAATVVVFTDAMLQREALCMHRRAMLEQYC